MKTKEIKKIESLMNQINASKWFRTNVAGILKDPKREDIFPNQIINALNLAIELNKGTINVGNMASMQSGKSGTISFLCNYVLPEIGFLKEGQNVLFTTSMPDTDLFIQNKINMEKEAYDFEKHDRFKSRIKVFMLSRFFKNPNPLKVVNDYKIQLIVRDEEHFGNSESSVFDNAFFKNLRIFLPQMPYLPVSATLFDLLDAKAKGFDVSIIEGVRSQYYFGITEMLKSGLVQNLPANFSVIEKCQRKECGFKLNSIVKDYLNHLMNFESGLGIVRVNSKQAKVLRMLIKRIYKGEMECLFIGSNAACDYSIGTGIKEVEELVLSQKKRVVLIIVQALSAGKDFKNLKEVLRFGIETRQKQLANVVQGLPGRFCGYHSNRTFKLLASIPLLTKYSELEIDYTKFYDQEWRRGIAEFTTQSKALVVVKEGEKTTIEFFEPFTFEQMNTASVRKFVDSHIGEDSTERIMGTFQKKFYHSNPKIAFRLKDKSGKSTVRLASAYGADKTNRVYTLWKNINKDSDFNSVLFKKDKVYSYGILISNYPVGHPKNTLGFCGIMLIKSGPVKYFTQELDIDNGAMYSIAV